MGSRSIVEAIRWRPPAGVFAPDSTARMVLYDFSGGWFFTLDSAVCSEDFLAMGAVEGAMTWCRPEVRRP